MRPRLLAWAAVPLATACTAPIDPPWLVAGPRELAMEIEVVAQGPYGARLRPGPRTFRDALPLDTLRLRPVVVDEDGPMDPAMLEGAWMACSGIGNCLLRSPVVERPTCTGQDIQPPEPCRFGEGGEATLTVAELPATLPTDLGAVIDLISGPTVAFIASTPEGPGLDRCLARLDAREPLDGCLMMERTLGIGPLGELVALLDALGIDPGFGEEAQPLLARPRNRNPAVEEIRVEIGDESMLVASGSAITVPRDQAVTLTVETTDDDLDGYETTVSGQVVLLTDDLGAQWWFDREVDLEPTPPGQPWARLRAGAVMGTTRAYVVLRDGYGGEAWGWLDLDFAG